MPQDALDSVVAPDAVRQLDVTKSEVERVDDLVDCLTCIGRSGLQPHDPSVEVPSERPEHMNVKSVLGGSEDEENDEQGATESQKGGIVHAQQVGVGGHLARFPEGLLRTKGAITQPRPFISRPKDHDTRTTARVTRLFKSNKKSNGQAFGLNNPGPHRSVMNSQKVTFVSD